MINMLPSVLLPAFPILWGAVAVFLWGRGLANPALFGVVSGLTAFGVQAIVRFAWANRTSFQGNLVAIAGKPTPEEIAAMLVRQNQDAMIIAAIVLVVSVLLAFWMRSGFIRRA
jgi:hypothetical protein